MKNKTNNGYECPTFEVLNMNLLNPVLVASTVNGTEDYVDGGTIDTLFE